MPGRSEGPDGPGKSARDEVARGNERLLREFSRGLAGPMARRPVRLLPSWRTIDAAIRRVESEGEAPRRAAG